MGNVRKIVEQAEELIEETILDEVEAGSSDEILKRFQKAKSMLDAIEPRDEKDNREHKRVLSYALMRIDETLNNLGNTEDTMKRAEESLKYAIESGDLVQIARCRLMLGIRLLNIGKIPEAEQHFTDIITGEIDSDNKDMLQTVG